MTGMGWAGLKVDFNTESTEFTEEEKRRLGEVGGDHGKL
jgi:hypothetical protein